MCDKTTGVQRTLLSPSAGRTHTLYTCGGQGPAACFYCINATQHVAPLFTVGQARPLDRFLTRSGKSNCGPEGVTRSEGVSVLPIELTVLRETLLPKVYYLLKCPQDTVYRTTVIKIRFGFSVLSVQRFQTYSDINYHSILLQSSFKSILEEQYSCFERDSNTEILRG
jgi:hypothetical protein